MEKYNRLHTCMYKKQQTRCLSETNQRKCVLPISTCASAKLVIIAKIFIKTKTHTKNNARFDKLLNLYAKKYINYEIGCTYAKTYGQNVPCTTVARMFRV